MRFFEVLEDKTTRRSGHIDGVHRWLLPSIACKLCGGYGGAGETYPTVDLSEFPERSLLEEPRCMQATSIGEYEKLCGLLRPLCPQGAPLEPGTAFGPLEGKATGVFGDFYFFSLTQPLVSSRTLGRLQNAGVRGLKGSRPELRYRGKNPPDLLEVEVQVRGRLHPMCFPESWREPCRQCGCSHNRFPAEAPVLRAATLPEDIDVFRLHDFKTILIANERFVDAVKQLQLSDIVFREIPAH